MISATIETQIERKWSVSVASPAAGKQGGGYNKRRAVSGKRSSVVFMPNLYKSCPGGSV